MGEFLMFFYDQWQYRTYKGGYYREYDRNIRLLRQKQSLVLYYNKSKAVMEIEVREQISTCF